MTTALPSVYRGSCVVLGTNNYSGMPPSQGPNIVAHNSWTHSAADEGDGGSGLGAPLTSVASVPSHFNSVLLPAPSSGQLGPQQLPTTPEGLHRYLRDRVQAATASSRGPLAATAAFASPAPYSAYLAGPPRSPTPEQTRGTERPRTTTGAGATAGTMYGSAGGGGGGRGSGTSPPGRMITHDAFINRPETSAAHSSGSSLDRGRLLVGSSHELRGGGPGPPSSSPRGSAGAQQCSWLSMPATPPGQGGWGGGDRMSRGSARGMSGGAVTLVRSPSSSPRELGVQLQPRLGASSLPTSASGRRSPSPRLLHPGLGSGAVSVIAAGHNISRNQLVAQYRAVERLLALDMDEVLLRSSPSSRQVPTLTPGSLDGMGHPVLIAADGARILKRIPDHQPRFAAERMIATPLRLEQLGLAPGQILDPDLELDAMPHSPDGGDGDLSSSDDDFLPQRSSANNNYVPRLHGGALHHMGAATEGGGGGGGGGGEGRQVGGKMAPRSTARPSQVGGGGGGGGGSPQRLPRGWASPQRPPRAARAEAVDGGGGAGGAAAAGGSSCLAAESSRASRIGGDMRPNAGGKSRASSRSPPPVVPQEPQPQGKGSSPTRSAGGLGPPGHSEESGSVMPPKWLGSYIPKEDPLGLWTGKRMSKTEVIVEKRLFAMRHNPGMRLELESRAAEALRQRAAAQAEMAAVTRAREEEALARKAQLKAEIEARRRGWNPRDMERSRSRNRGMTREAKMALEKQLLAEAAAEPRGPLSIDEAATVIQSMWRMFQQRRTFLFFRDMVIRIQRAARLRYCVVRNRRRHAAAAVLLLEFLQAIGGTRQASAAMDLREIHSNYIRRRLLEKKGDLRHQTAVAVLVREWDAVEARILGLRSRSLKGPALAAMAAAGFSSIAGNSHHNNHHNHHNHHQPYRNSTAGADKDMLTAVAGEAHTAAHGTRLLGKALEARKKGVMLLGGGRDQNKQMTVEYAVARALANDRVTLSSREPVQSEVKAVVAACYLEHKAMAYNAFIGVVWRRRARWFGMYNQQRHMAMARSVVATGSAWQAMDALAREATEKLVGQLPVLPRMRTTATLRELRALMQAGVQEADLFTSYMLKGGIHELERRLHGEMLLRTSFGHMLRGQIREVGTPPTLPPPPPPQSQGNTQQWQHGRRPSHAGGSGPGSPGYRRVSVPGGPNAGRNASPTTQASTSSVLPDSPRGPRVSARVVRIDPAAQAHQQGSGPANEAAFLDTVSEAGSEMTVVSTTSALASATANLARARFLAVMPSHKAGVAQLKERWWRDAVVRVDACLRKRYKLNSVSLVAALEDTSAPNLELFSAKLAEINSNPEKSEVLLAALPGGNGQVPTKHRVSGEGAWSRGLLPGGV